MAFRVRAVRDVEEYRSALGGIGHLELRQVIQEAIEVVENLGRELDAGHARRASTIELAR